MTYDELYKKVEGIWHDSFKSQSWQIVWDLVKLHKPHEEMPYLCKECWTEYNFAAHPCPTIQLIEKNLS